jgi:hypothetical protein
MKAQIKCRRFLFVLFPFFLFSWGIDAPVAAQDIEVTSAVPNEAPQGTVSLDVEVNGKGFKKGAKAKFYMSGTSLPGGITTNSTKYLTPNKLKVNITVADNAQAVKYDIEVRSNGRTGKGIELFKVVEKTNPQTCVLPEFPPDGFSLLTTVALPNTHMFGRQVAGRHVAATINGVDNPILFAVVEHGDDENIHFFTLDPASESVQYTGKSFPTVTNPKFLKMGYFNGDNIPDLVYSWLYSEIVEVFLSDGDDSLNYTSTVVPVPDGAVSWGSAIAVADIDGDGLDEFAVGARGSSTGKHKGYGKVYLYDAEDLSEPIQTVDSTAHGDLTKADWFGEDVAFGNVDGLGDLEMVVGLAARQIGREKEAGEVWVVPKSEGVFNIHSAYAVISGSDSGDRIGSAVAAEGIYIVGATSWGGNDVRAELLKDLDEEVVLPPATDEDTTGWATSGVASGYLGSGTEPAWLIGVPNAACGGDSSSGAAHLFMAENNYSPLVFKPSERNEPDGQWNAFGWDARIISTNDRSQSYVFIGEPGRATDGEWAVGRVYIYKFTP